MNRILTKIVFFLAICSTLSAEPWRAGVARISITPDQYMWLSGYAARNRPADGQLTELWAKALALQDPAGTRVVLVTCDLIGMDREVASEITRRLHDAYGLTRDQIAICTSHTHSGPVIAGTLAPMHSLLDPAQQQLVLDYTQSLQERIVDVVGQSLQRLEPVGLAWGVGSASFAVNRRENREPDVPQLRKAGMLKGPYDHQVPVMSVNRADGSRLAVVFGYACHATVLDGYQWCGDYPGYAQLELEQRHPGTMALFCAGCGADQNPLPRRQIELAQNYGCQLADSVDAVLAAPLTAVTGQLTATYQEIDLPLGQLPTREELVADTRSENPYLAARAKSLLAQLDKGEPLAPTYPYPVQTWRIGSQLVHIFLGGEVVVDYALRLKGSEETEREASSLLWVTAYANDVMAYIPSRRVLAEGGYEGATSMIYYGLPTSWGPAVEETIVREVVRQKSIR